MSCVLKRRVVPINSPGTDISRRRGMQWKPTWNMWVSQLSSESTEDWNPAQGVTKPTEKGRKRERREEKRERGASAMLPRP